MSNYQIYCFFLLKWELLLSLHILLKSNDGVKVSVFSRVLPKKFVIYDI